MFLNQASFFIFMKNTSFKRKRKDKEIVFHKLDPIQGFALDEKIAFADLPEKFLHLGFQASQLGRACLLAKEMKKQKCAIFLSATSNMGSSGMREIIAQLCEKKIITAIITTTGTIEEDVMKTFHDFRLGEFDVVDEQIKENCLNRIGNIFVPDDYYCEFEDWHTKFLKNLHAKKAIIAPSQYIREMGLSLNDKNSILYQAAKNDIPIFAPGLVDGAMGDHIFFFNQNRKDPLVIDVAKDLDIFYKMILTPDNISGIILGGGIAKHHLIGAAILRDGLDYSIYLSTGTQYDGSLSGAHPKEAISWNKLKKRKNSVMVEADATLTFPFVAMSLTQK